MFRKNVNRLNNITFYLNIGLMTYGIVNYKYFTEKNKQVLFYF